MKLVPLAAIAATLLLAACGGGTPSPTPSASASASTAPAQQTTAAAPAKTDALEPLFGTWAADLGQCGKTPGPITISQTRFEGAENGCDISGFTDNGNGSYTAALACQSQGKAANENIQMTPIFTPTGEGIDLVYVDRDKQSFTVLRCPTAKPKS